MPISKPKVKRYAGGVKGRKKARAQDVKPDLRNGNSVVKKSLSDEHRKKISQGLKKHHSGKATAAGGRASGGAKRSGTGSGPARKSLKAGAKGGAKRSGSKAKR